MANHDYTSAARQQRWRERQRKLAYARKRCGTAIDRVIVEGKTDINLFWVYAWRRAAGI